MYATSTQTVFCYKISLKILVSKEGRHNGPLIKIVHLVRLYATDISAIEIHVRCYYNSWLLGGNLHWFPHISEVTGHNPPDITPSRSESPVQWQGRIKPT